MINCIKRLLSLTLTLMLLFGIVGISGIQVSAAEYISTPEELHGENYSGSSLMASVLDKIFVGDIDIYTDKNLTVEASLPVGSRVDAGTQYYIYSKNHKSQTSGWQCYIYANAVYTKLFGEWVRHGDNLKNSEVVIPGGSTTISYEMFRDAGVRCGAYLRTTGNADGSYSSGVGHSMIILAYGKENLTFLEGNADGKGLVRVTVRTWSDFSDRLIGGRGRYLNHVVQPKAAYYDSLYPNCPHEAYSDLGVCKQCGYSFEWMATGDPWAMGYYRMTKNVKPSMDAPYDAAPRAGLTLVEGMKIEMLEKYTNAFGQTWYGYEAAGGVMYFVPADAVKFESYLDFEVTCKDFSPPDQSILEPQSYPVKGIVTANYPIQQLFAYLDGKEYARWTATNQITTRVDLRSTDVNYNLSFSKLQPGEHTITIKATSFLHHEPVTFHESTFYMNEACQHNYSSVVTEEATCTTDGIRTYTCDYCGDSYTREISAYGHNYVNGICSHCDDRIDVKLTGAVVSGGASGDEVTITLYSDNGKTYTSTTKTDSYVFDCVPAGSYTMQYSKNGCVTGFVNVNLTAANAIWDIKLCPKGDVTCNLSVNMGDVARAYSHVRGTNKLTDAYALLCIDFTEDGSVNVGDVAKLYTMVRGKLK